MSLEQEVQGGPKAELGGGGEHRKPLWIHFLPPVSDGPTNIRVFNLTKETAVLSWEPPNKSVDNYNLEVTAEKGEAG